MASNIKSDHLHSKQILISQLLLLHWISKFYKKNICHHLFPICLQNHSITKGKLLPKLFWCLIQLKLQMLTWNIHHSHIFYAIFSFHCSSVFKIDSWLKGWTPPQIENLAQCKQILDILRKRISTRVKLTQPFCTKNFANSHSALLCVVQKKICGNTFVEKSIYI